VNSLRSNLLVGGIVEQKIDEYLNKKLSAESFGYRRLANCMNDLEKHYISEKELIESEKW
jgi:hypothetical protein